MNYERTELLQLLAATYAAGTLRGRARQRFERLCDRSAVARRTRHRWEDRLLPMALSLPPIAPRRDLLPAIRAQLAWAPPPQTAVTRTRRWWSLAAAASVLVIVGMLTRLMLMPGAEWQPMATVSMANVPTWIIERSKDNQRLFVRTAGRPAPGTARDYELWLLPVVPGANPVSLGVLPRTGTYELTLNATQRALMASVTTLAVTIEPLGGSPSGLPTGAVVATAPVVTT
jgi:anti-sigma-K factor RskA